MAPLHKECQFKMKFKKMCNISERLLSSVLFLCSLFFFKNNLWFFVSFDSGQMREMLLAEIPI